MTIYDDGNLGAVDGDGVPVYRDMIATLSQCMQWYDISQKIMSAFSQRKPIWFKSGSYEVFEPGILLKIVCQLYTLR